MLFKSRLLSALFGALFLLTLGAADIWAAPKKDFPPSLDPQNPYVGGDFKPRHTTGGFQKTARFFELGAANVRLQHYANLLESGAYLQAEQYRFYVSRVYWAYRYEHNFRQLPRIPRFGLEVVKNDAQRTLIRAARELEHQDNRQLPDFYRPLGDTLVTEEERRAIQDLLKKKKDINRVEENIPEEGDDEEEKEEDVADREDAIREQQLLLDQAQANLLAQRQRLQQAQQLIQRIHTPDVSTTIVRPTTIEQRPPQTNVSFGQMSPLQLAPIVQTPLISSFNTFSTKNMSAKQPVQLSQSSINQMNQDRLKKQQAKQLSRDLANLQLEEQQSLQEGSKTIKPWRAKTIQKKEQREKEQQEKTEEGQNITSEPALVTHNATHIPNLTTITYGDQDPTYALEFSPTTTHQLSQLPPEHGDALITQLRAILREALDSLDLSK